MKHHTDWTVEHLKTDASTPTGMGTGTGTGTRPSSDGNSASILSVSAPAGGVPVGGVAGDGVLRWTSPTGATYVTKPTPHTPATLAKNLNENTGDSTIDDTDKPPF